MFLLLEIERKFLNNSIGYTENNYIVLFTHSELKQGCLALTVSWTILPADIERLLQARYKSSASSFQF